MLASLSDIQSWLGDDKIIVTDAMAIKPELEAERLIRGQLAGVFTALTMTSWAAPDDTPELIRGIAGRLTAAFIYRSTYSEEQAEVPEYAQNLYNEAISLLKDIKSGAIVVLDPDNEPVGESGDILSFWPDDTTTPKFTMDQEFA